jgi:hypothetical protein
MSEVKVNKISPRSGTTVTLGDSGDTFTIPSGATITNNGTQTGFGRTGTVDWDTTPKTATFTAVSGEGYFCDTSSGAFTVNFPAGSAGAIVSVSDYTRTFQTNNLTISPNGSEKIGGIAADATLSTEGQTATFVYVDGTEGWINIQETSNSVTGRAVTNFIIATGGTETTSGDYKIHTFTAPGTFTVTNEGTSCGSTRLDYMVIAGGGAGGHGGTPGGNGTGGGGAGGFRESVPSPAAWTASPLATTTGLTAAFQAYPITVGAGASYVPGSQPSTVPGSASIFSTITSAGGGSGGGSGPAGDGGNGGSGGGGTGGTGASQTGGSGNTPPVSPPQGNNGGNNNPSPGYGSGGGGGSTAVGGNASGGSNGTGGAGATTSINATPTVRAGGGGGGGYAAGSPGGALGGPGGGGPGANHNGAGTAGTVNTGSGGGGSGSSVCAGGNGGSGLIIIRYKFQ